MFRYKWLIFSLVIIFGASAFIPILKFSAKDIEYYKNLMNTDSGALIEDSTSKHERQRVSKEIRYQNIAALHCYIESNQSDLFFLTEKNKSEIVEELDAVECIVQEELYYLLENGQEAILREDGNVVLRSAPETIVDLSKEQLTPMQALHRVEAEKAYYNYSTQVFFAENVLLWKYHLPGHTLIKKLDAHPPSMQGTAESIKFALKGNKFTFKAEKMEAKWEDEIVPLTL